MLTRYEADAVIARANRALKELRRAISQLADDEIGLDNAMQLIVEGDEREIGRWITAPASADVALRAFRRLVYLGGPYFFVNVLEKSVFDAIRATVELCADETCGPEEARSLAARLRAVVGALQAGVAELAAIQAAPDDEPEAR